MLAQQLKTYFIALTNVSVRLPPQFVKQPEKEIIFETADKNVQLDCEAEGIPGVEYTWEKDGSDFELNKANIQTIPGTGSFYFKEIFALDAGDYIILMM